MTRKKLLIGLLVLIALLLGIGLALPLLIDVNAYRTPIQARASALLGREVRLGEMKLSMLPFGVRVDDVAVAALPEEADGDLITATSVRVGARMLPLLKGRLEATSIVVEEPHLQLVRELNGSWNVEQLLAGGDSDEDGAGNAERFEVDRLRLTGGVVTIRVLSEGTAPKLELTLEELDLTVSEFAADRPLVFELESAWREAPGARIAVSGELGVSGSTADGDSPGRPVDLQVQASHVPLLQLRPWLRSDLPLEGDDGEVGVDLTVRGSLPDRLDVQGDLTLGDARLSLTGTDGATRSTPLDTVVTLDIEAIDSGKKVEIRDMKVRSGGHELALRGSLEQRDPLPWLDLELLPASMPANELATLATLVAGQLPVRFGSEEPVQFQGRIRGVVGGDTLPEVEGSARLRGFVFQHPAMSQPIERVQADVTLSGERIEVREMAGVVGSSDIGGRLDVEGFATPSIRFNLVSKRADLDELFSFLEDEEPSTGAGTNGEDPLAGLRLDGTLEIEKGSFGKLEFTGLRTTMRWRDGVATLDPVQVALYDGSFQGKVSGDLGKTVPAWSVAGEARGIDVAPFLAANADIEELISGRFTGRVDTRTRGSEFETIIGNLNGGGNLEIVDGRIGALDVLKLLSRVSGVFGEDSLSKLSKQMATEGTEFQSLTSAVVLEKGRMRLNGIVLGSPSFQLTGDGIAELLSGQFAGEFRLNLSPEISAAMRQEKSKAAELFWNSRSSRVEMPFGLSGPFDAPTPSVDFKAAAGSAVKQRLEDRLKSKLGLGTEPQKQVAAVEAPAGEPSTEPIEITGTRWSGSLLARDLRIQGVARGTEIAGLKVEVVDAKGSRVALFDPVREVADALIASADATTPLSIDWKVKVDGKKLLVARLPVEVKATLSLQDGSKSEVTVSVDR